MTDFKMRQINQVWYYDRTINGRRIRGTTGTTDADLARRIAEDKVKKALESLSIGDWASHVNSKPKWLRDIFTSAQRRADRHGRLFTLTEQSLWELALWTNGKCQITGIPFEVGYRGDVRKQPYKPSLDRINCDQGYVPKNVRLVCVCVNIAMNQWGEDVLRRMAIGLLAKDLIEPWNALNSGQKKVTLEME